MPRLDAAPSKPSKKRRRWLLLPLALIALPTVLRLLGVQAANHASTSPDSDDATLRTRFYAASPPEVRSQVLAGVAGLSTYGQPWSVKSAGVADAQGGVEVRCEVLVLVFTDDLTITIEPHEGGSRVDVASASRVGQGDFGENARHVRQILSALDARLGKGAFNVEHL